jgi:WD40 repeat protein
MGTMRYAQGDTTAGYPTLALDHKTFATVSRYTPFRQGPVVCLWDADTGKELRQLYDPDFEHFHAFFLKSENLVGTIGVSRKPAQRDTHTYAMHFWDPATGKKAASSIEASGYHFEPWALSPDENWITCASREPPVVVLDRKTGKVVAEWKGDGTRVDHLVFGPDGKTVAICCGNAIHLWNWKGNGGPRRLGDFQENIERLWFSPDGRRIAAAVYKEGLRVWEANELKEVRRFEGEHNIRFSPDGKRIVSADTGTIWDVSSGKQLGKLEDCAHCLALDCSLDGRTATG